MNEAIFGSEETGHILQSYKFEKPQARCSVSGLVAIKKQIKNKGCVAIAPLINTKFCEPIGIAIF